MISNWKNVPIPLYNYYTAETISLISLQIEHGELIAEPLWHWQRCNGDLRLAPPVPQQGGLVSYTQRSLVEDKLGSASAELRSRAPFWRCSEGAHCLSKQPRGPRQAERVG